MILPEKRNRTIHLIRATAIPGRQRHGTEKNRSTIRKRRAIPKRESSFPVFLFFPRPSFRHSPTGTFNYSPSSALSPSADRHPGMLCKTLFHFDGAFTKPVEILGPPLLQKISLNKSALFRKHIYPYPSSKRDFPRGESLQNPKTSIFRNTIPGIPRIARTRRKRFSEEISDRNVRESTFPSKRKGDGPESLRSISENRRDSPRETPTG